MRRCCQTCAPPAATGSHENVTAIRDGYAHYNQGDGTPSPELWHEHAVYHTAPDDPDSGAHHGIHAIARLFASWREAYPDLRVEVHDAKAKHDRVFAWIRLLGRGAISGIPIHMDLAHVYTMRDGRAVRLVEYSDRAGGP